MENSYIPPLCTVGGSIAPICYAIATDCTVASEKKDWVVVNPLTLDKLAKGSPSGASFLLVLMKLFICMTCKCLLHLALLFFFLQIYIDTFLGGKSIHFFTLELSKCLIIFCVRVKFLHFVLTKVKSINRPLSSTVP